MRRLAMILLLSPLLTSCKKDGDTTPPDDGGDADTGDADTGEPVDDVVPQDPDPPELAAARTALVLGDMETVKSTMEPLMGSLTEPSQARANGIASALFALAAAEELPENAQEPAENALAKAQEVRDDEVRQLGCIALGAYLVGVGDGAAAQAELEKATAISGPNSDLANLYLAQAMLNQAFDESDKLVDPSKLDEAKKLYQTAAESSDAAIKGRGQSGLAAIAKYQRKKEEICEHAKAAAESFEAAGASDYLKEVPSILADEAKCK